MEERGVAVGSSNSGGVVGEGCSVLFLGPEPPRRLGFPGISVVAWSPVVVLRPIDGCSARFLEEAGACDWVVFTSPRGPHILFRDASRLGLVERVVETLSSRRVAAVGPSTAGSLAEVFGVEPVLVPGEYTGRSLARALVAQGPRCVLLARSRRGVRDLPDILEASGITFREIALYDEEPNLRALPLAVELAERVDYVLLTSPLIAELYCRYIAPHVRRARILAIGPSTLRAARKYCPGLAGEAEPPDQYTYDALLAEAAKKCREK